MTRTWPTRFTLVIVSLSFVASTAQAQLGATVSNWPVPSSPSGSSSRIRALADVTNPLPFIGVTPCRIVDTRGPAGTFGAPSLPASTPRNFPLPSGPCAGIPATASAYSLNITVTNTLGPGFISIYPQGGAAPLVSTLNYLAGQTLANAAIVPAGTSGGVTVVAGVSGTDLIIDINGYYAAAAGNQANTFTVINSGATTVPAILGQTNGTSLNATGVKGLANAATGITNGVVGQNLSSTDGATGVFGVAEAGSGITTGVWGRTRSSSNDARGVLGEAVSTMGNTNAVWGINSSNSLSSSGVRGDTSSGFGVHGVATASSGIAIIGEAFNQATKAAVFAGNVDVEGTLTKGGGSFKIDHPLDPANKYLSHSFVESSDMMNIYNGNVILDRTGSAVVVMPDWFEALNRDFRYQLTCVGAFAPVYVAEELAGNRFRIAGGRPGLKVSWTITGIRQDVWANAHRIPVEEEKTEFERGHYLYPTLYGEKEEKGMLALRKKLVLKDGKPTLKEEFQERWP